VEAGEALHEEEGRHIDEGVQVADHEEPGVQTTEGFELGDGVQTAEGFKLGDGEGVQEGAGVQTTEGFLMDEGVQEGEGVQIAEGVHEGWPGSSTFTCGQKDFDQVWMEKNYSYR
jgi:hypothetical protein